MTSDPGRRAEEEANASDARAKKPGVIATMTRHQQHLCRIVSGTLLALGLSGAGAGEDA